MSRRPAFLAVDLVGALHIVGTLIAYLSLATLVPAAVALGYGEPVWPFLASGALAGGIGGAVALATRGDHRLNVREGFLVVSLTWLAAAALGALPYIFSGDPQINRLVDAYFEGMSGFSTTGGSIVVNVEELPRGLAMWRQFSQWLGGIGIIVLALAVLPRLRVGGRQLLEHEMPGPEIESLSTRIRDTARRVWILYIALTVVLFGIFLGALGDRRRRGDDAVPRVRARLHDDPDGRLLDQVELDRGLRAGDAVGRDPLHGPRRDQLRADVPRARAPTATRRLPRSGIAALPVPARARLGRDRRPRSGRRTCSRAGMRSAPASSRPSRR